MTLLAAASVVAGWWVVEELNSLRQVNRAQGEVLVELQNPEPWERTVDDVDLALSELTGRVEALEAQELTDSSLCRLLGGRMQYAVDEGCLLPVDERQVCRLLGGRYVVNRCDLF